MLHHEGIGGSGIFKRCEYELLRALQKFLFKVRIQFVEIHVICRIHTSIHLAIIKEADSCLKVATLSFYQPSSKLSSYLIGIHSFALFRNDTAVIVLKQYW